MTRSRDAASRASASASEIVRRRLEAQRLSTTTFTRPADVVAWFGAVQAQDYLGALWAVGLRLAAAHERDVESALAERTIVRSWPMRGTLHFLAAADARWMIELLAPRAARAATNRLRRMGIDDQVLSRARRVLVKHLEDGRRLTRPAAYRALERARVPTDGERGLHILWRLAHDGLICMGPREGKQHCFVLLDEWLPDAKRLSHDEALAEVACRYFRAHGPATLRDFAWWSGMTLAEARRATSMAGKRIEQEVIAGEVYWFGLAGGSTGSTRAFALPAFDEFFVGYADRSAAVDPRQAARMTAFVLLGPVIVQGARVAATWKRRIAGDQVVFSMQPLAPLAKTSGARAALMRGALARYARFLGLPHAFEEP